MAKRWRLRPARIVWVLWNPGTARFRHDPSPLCSTKREAVEEAKVRDQLEPLDVAQKWEALKYVLEPNDE